MPSRPGTSQGPVRERMALRPQASFMNSTGPARPASCPPGKSLGGLETKVEASSNSLQLSAPKKLRAQDLFALSIDKVDFSSDKVKLPDPLQKKYKQLPLRRSRIHSTAKDNMYYLSGEKLREQRDLPAAAAAFLHAIDSNPFSVRYYLSLGTLLSEVGQHSVAKQCYRNATIVDASCAISWFDLGLSLFEIGQLDESIDALSTAVNLSKQQDNLDMYYTRAMVYRSAGEFKLSMVDYETCRSIGSRTTQLPELARAESSIPAEKKKTVEERASGPFFGSKSKLQNAGQSKWASAISTTQVQTLHPCSNGLFPTVLPRGLNVSRPALGQKSACHSSCWNFVVLSQFRRCFSKRVPTPLVARNS